MLVLLARGKAKPLFEFVPIQTGRLAMDAVLAGDIDVGVLVDSNIAFVRFEGGDDLGVIASIQKKTDDGLVSRRDRNIRSAADLRGKTIGHLPATTSHVFLARYLAAHNLTFNDVKAVSMAPPAMQAAITRGDVDAISVWQPFRYNAIQQLGTNAIEFRNSGEYVAVLAVRKSTIAGKRRELVSFLATLLAAEEVLRSSPEQAISALAEAIPMDRTALEKAWGEYDTRLLLDDSLLTLLREEGRWISETQENFKGRAEPDYSTSLVPELLREAAPDRVSISANKTR
jgi:NitT/TauT family transport system substrate-binding protein